MRKRIAFLLVLLGLIGGVAWKTLGADGLPFGRRPLSVVLISIDTLRANHMGCYGYERDTSPEMDRLAESGILFRNVVAQSTWTLPSHVSLFSSLYPTTHGVTTEKVGLRKDIEMLPQLFQKANYRTEGVVSSPYVGARYGFDRGFDDFGMLPKPIPENSKRITAEAVKRLQSLSSAGKPFFLFLHYLGPHTPYDPPAPFDSMYDPGYQGKIDGTGPTIYRHMSAESKLSEEDLRHIIALYDGEIAHIDGFIRKLYDEILRLKLERKVLFIVLSDHGEEFKDHGSMDHGRSLYEEVLQVPLFMVCPGLLPAGKTVETQVQLLDLFPTLCDLLGFPKPRALQGRSFQPLLNGGVISRSRFRPERYAFGEITRQGARPYTMRCVRESAGKKLILTSEPSSSQQLYDLKLDPTERSDLSQNNPVLLKELQDVLADWQMKAVQTAETGRGSAGEAVELSQEHLSILKDLGYMGPANAPDEKAKATPQVAPLFRSTGPVLQGFKEPRGLYLGPGPLLYVADFRNHRIVIVDSTLKSIKAYGGPDKGEEVGRFHDPAAVAVDGSGILYVADTMNNRVQVLMPDGSARMIWPNVVVPRGIALSPDAKSIYVAQTPLSQIALYSSEGRQLGTWGQPGQGPGQLSKPVGLAVDPDGNLWVADWGNARVQVFAPNGAPQRRWPVEGWQGSVEGAEPYLALAANGHVILSDPSHDRLLEYGPEGTLLAASSSASGSPLRMPSGVACLPDGSVAVSDTGNHDVRIVKPEEFEKVPG